MSKFNKNLEIIILLTIIGSLFLGFSIYEKSKVEVAVKTSPVSNGLLGESGFSGPVLFKISSSSLTQIRGLDFYLDDNSTASSTADFSFDTGLNIFKASGSIDFYAEIRPDGSTCSNGEIIKKTGADDWDCATDAGGSVSSDSLNFDELQDPLVLDTNITTTSGSFTWDFGGSNLVGIGFASLSRGFEVRNTVGTTASISGIFWVDAANKKVGIGTPTPDSVLHVLTPSASTEAVKIQGKLSQSAAYLGIYNSANQLLFDFDGDGSFYLQNAGASLYTQTSPGALSFVNSNTTIAFKNTSAVQKSVIYAISTPFTGGTGVAGSTGPLALYTENALEFGSLGDNLRVVVDDAFYIGNGKTRTAPATFNIQGTGGSGTDIAGAALTLAGGQGTGTGAGGSIIFQTAPAGASSSTLNSLSTRMTIDSVGRVGIGATPTTVLEVQGTASASYLLTGNTLQVGGFASVAYSRFGTSTTGHSNYISTINDLLVSGDLETKGTVSFAGTASISGKAFFPGISAGAGGDTDACLNATTNELTDAGANTCIVSSKRFKDHVGYLTDGLQKVLKLKPVVYINKNDPKRIEQIGFYAEDALGVEPRLVFYEADGKTPRGFLYEQSTALLALAIQEQQKQINELKELIKDNPRIMEGNLWKKIWNLIASII